MKVWSNSGQEIRYCKANKLEQWIEDLERRLIKHENEVAPKIVELEDQIKTKCSDLWY